MRDAASAAAMSDPDQNRWFRRRWVEPELCMLVDKPAESTAMAPDDDSGGFDRIGLDLLSEWRRGRFEQDAATP